MKFVCESNILDEYLLELPELNYSHPIIQDKSTELFHQAHTEIEIVKIAYEFARDEISHSMDIQSKIVTCIASDVLLYNEGICYAKANLLAALLRSKEIPTGFCYQRLLLFDTPEKGYSIHALNAIYLKSLNKWIRLDARGNKSGIDAQFSLDQEKLAFLPQTNLSEMDYPIIYTKPHPKTIAVLKASSNALEMCKNHLPVDL